jgi:hypothetical protein
MGIGWMISCEVFDVIEFLKGGNYAVCSDDVQMIEPRKFESFTDGVQWFPQVSPKGQNISFRP